MILFHCGAGVSRLFILVVHALASAIQPHSIKREAILRLLIWMKKRFSHPKVTKSPKMGWRAKLSLANRHVTEAHHRKPIQPQFNRKKGAGIKGRVFYYLSWRFHSNCHWFTYVSQSCVNTIRMHFPWRFPYFLALLEQTSLACFFFNFPM